MKRLWELFLTFAKIGLFTIGGGYAMIPLIEDTCVERKQWITHEEMLNLTVIAESTPGPIAINAATYVGFRQAGLLGAILATLGMTIPSFAVILLISLFFDRFLEYPLIADAFRGIRIAVGLLIFDAGLRMLKKARKTLLTGIVAAISFAVMIAVDLFAWNFSSMILLLSAALIGLVCEAVAGFSRGKGGDAK